MACDVKEVSSGLRINAPGMMGRKSGAAAVPAGYVSPTFLAQRELNKKYSRYPIERATFRG
jgi:hypothetical protein